MNSRESQDMLTVTVETRDPTIRVLRLRGDLNALTAPDLEQILEGQLAAEPSAVIIDVGELDHLGPDGVLVLVCTAYRAGLESIGFCVAAARSAVLNALVATGMIDILDLHDTVEDALITYG
jgi:anti-anti-sigma factor